MLTGGKWSPRWPIVDWIVLALLAMSALAQDQASVQPTLGQVPPLPPRTPKDIPASPGGRGRNRLDLNGLPTDGSADATDMDRDGNNVWQEWRGGTCPTNALSALRLLTASPGGTSVTGSWQSVAGVTYLPEPSTSLAMPTVGAHEYLRTQALGRIYLDNFTNVQSSWVTQGLEIGQIALKFGANDLGSIMIEENAVSQAGTTFRMTVADMHRLIKDLGCEPHQRDNWYRLLN